MITTDSRSMSQSRKTRTGCLGVTSYWGKLEPEYRGRSGSPVPETKVAIPECKQSARSLELPTSWWFIPGLSASLFLKGHGQAPTWSCNLNVAFRSYQKLVCLFSYLLILTPLSLPYSSVCEWEVGGRQRSRSANIKFILVVCKFYILGLLLSVPIR